MRTSTCERAGDATTDLVFSGDAAAHDACEPSNRPTGLPRRVSHIKLCNPEAYTYAIAPASDATTNREGDTLHAAMANDPAFLVAFDESSMRVVSFEHAVADACRKLKDAWMTSQTRPEFEPYRPLCAHFVRQMRRSIGKRYISVVKRKCTASEVRTQVRALLVDQWGGGGATPTDHNGRGQREQRQREHAEHAVSLSLHDCVSVFDAVGEERLPEGVPVRLIRVRPVATRRSRPAIGGQR